MTNKQMRKEDCIHYEWAENNKETCSLIENNLRECVLLNCDYCEDFSNGR